MKLLWKPLSALCLLASPLLAGALILEIGNPAANAEAMKNHAVLVVRITACRSPEKTSVSASAVGIINGTQQAIPLKVIPLSVAGTYAVTHEWPQTGNWAVKMVATNPDYKDYATSVVIPFREDAMKISDAKHYFHAATESEVAVAIN
jgi:hypothetical protein